MKNNQKEKKKGLRARLMWSNCLASASLEFKTSVLQKKKVALNIFHAPSIHIFLLT
jgi:hypothetical protein